MDAPNTLSTPSGFRRANEAHAEMAEFRWNGLYQAGGAAALTSAVLTLVGVAVFIGWPPPLEGTAIDWITLFQNSWLLGLLGLDLVFMAVYVLLIPIYLSLYLALRRAAESAMVLAAALGFVAISVYLTSNPGFEMLSISQGYTAATTEVERSMFLAAGQAVLSTFQGTAFKVSYLLASTAGVIIALVILRSGVFSKATGYARLLGSVLGLGLFMPVIGMPLALLSVVFEWTWYVLLARGLFKLGRGVPK